MFATLLTLIGHELHVVGSCVHTKAECTTIGQKLEANNQKQIRITRIIVVTVKIHKQFPFRPMAVLKIWGYFQSCYSQLFGHC